MIETFQQERYDASRKAAFIEKFADQYQRSPEYKWIVDNTVYLRENEIHESQRVVGGTPVHRLSI